MEQLTKEQAIAFAESQAWAEMSYRERAEFQMMQEKLCMPFNVFHEAIEKTLGRPVFTHEFGLNHSGLMKELFDGVPAPTFEDIVNLIPKEKLIIVFGERLFDSNK